MERLQIRKGRETIETILFMHSVPFPTYLGIGQPQLDQFCNCENLQTPAKSFADFPNSIASASVRMVHPIFFVPLYPNRLR